jgi:hypothetical protein
MIHQTYLLIEAHNATLDVERGNTEIIIADIQQVHEQWNAILSRDKFTSSVTILAFHLSLPAIARYVTSRMLKNITESMSSLIWLIPVYRVVEGGLNQLI